MSVLTTIEIPESFKCLAKGRNGWMHLRALQLLDNPDREIVTICVAHTKGWSESCIIELPRNREVVKKLIEALEVIAGEET